MIDTLDLTKKEDLIKFHEYVDEIRHNDLFKIIANEFGFDDEVLDTLETIADNVYNDSDDAENVPVRPSEKLSTEEGLQLHKLVGEYVDTMIKPYAKGIVDNNTINDAYAGLYEFAAWILKK